MKRTVLLSLLTFAALFFFGKDTLAQFNNRIGKIWYDEGYLYVNAPERGVWVVDNYDPKAPKRVGFIEIPGNVDIAVQGTILYADSYDDLVCLDISNMENIREIKRIPKVFSQRKKAGFRTSSDSRIVWRNGATPNDLSTLFRQTITQISPINGNGGTFGQTGTGNVLVQNLNTPTTGGSAASSNTKGGSMACFTIAGNYMYAVDAQYLHVFDIKKPADPVKTGGSLFVGTDIETIFSVDEKLFIGSALGMFIYDLTNPANPQRLGQYEHTRSCDPVVVEGNYAYVTLRDGTDCRGGVNQLDILDITNPSRPRKIRTYSMHNPHGLGIDSGVLFICDGSAGLKVFDASNPNKIEEIQRFPGINTFDVIPVGSKKNLIMVGNDRIYQYDYKDVKNIRLLSEFSVYEIH
jgi:hypothetical protein